MGSPKPLFIQLSHGCSIVSPIEHTFDLGAPKLQHDPGVEIQDLTIRELFATAARLGVTPVSLLPEVDLMPEPTVPEATS